MHAALHTGSLPARRRGARLTRRMREGVLLSAAIATAGVLLVAPAHAEPIPGIGTGSAAAATEPTPQANFAPPSINIADGEVVGVAQPIIITFKEPVTDPRHRREGHSDHLVEACSRPLLLARRQAGALAAERLLAGQHRRAGAGGRHHQLVPHR